MQASPLGRLPAELRVEIYELVLKCKRPITFFAWGPFRIAPSTSDSLGGLRGVLALTRTSQEIRTEALPVFFGANKFIFMTNDIPIIEPPDQLLSGANGIQSWMHGVGSSCRAIKQVEVELGDWDNAGEDYTTHEIVTIVDKYKAVFANPATSLTVVFQKEYGSELRLILHDAKGARGNAQLAFQWLIDGKAFDPKSMPKAQPSEILRPLTDSDKKMMDKIVEVMQQRAGTTI